MFCPKTADGLKLGSQALLKEGIRGAAQFRLWWVWGWWVTAEGFWVQNWENVRTARSFWEPHISCRLFLSNISTYILTFVKMLTFALSFGEKISNSDSSSSPLPTLRLVTPAWRTDLSQEPLLLWNPEVFSLIYRCVPIPYLNTWKNVINVQREEGWEEKYLDKGDTLTKKPPKKPFPPGRSSGETRSEGRGDPRASRRTGWSARGAAGTPGRAPQGRTRRRGLRGARGRYGHAGSGRVGRPGLGPGDTPDRRPGLRGGERSTCHAGPAGLAQRRGPALPEELGRAAAGGNGARPGGQALGQSTQRAPGQEPAQAPQAFHGVAASGRGQQHPSPSCRAVAGPAAATATRPRAGAWGETAPYWACAGRAAPASPLPRMLGRCLWGALLASGCQWEVASRTWKVRGAGLGRWAGRVYLRGASCRTQILAPLERLARSVKGYCSR